MDTIFILTTATIASFGIGDVIGQHGGLLKNLDISDDSRSLIHSSIDDFLNNLFGNEPKEENKIISFTDHTPEILAQKKRSSSN